MRRLLATLLITLAATAVSAKPSEGERFNAWLDATWEETLIRSPILATLIGDSRYNDRIVDFTTAAWRADNRRFLERQLRELQRFDRKALVGQDRLSYDILKHDLTQSLEAERFPNWMQPVTQLRSFPSFLAEMGSGSSIQPFRTVKDYEDWLQATVGHAAHPRRHDRQHAHRPGQGRDTAETRHGEGDTPAGSPGDDRTGAEPVLGADEEFPGDHPCG